MALGLPVRRRRYHECQHQGLMVSSTRQGTGRKGKPTVQDREKGRRSPPARGSDFLRLPSRLGCRTTYPSQFLTSLEQTWRTQTKVRVFGEDDMEERSLPSQPNGRPWVSIRALDAHLIMAPGRLMIRIEAAPADNLRHVPMLRNRRRKGLAAASGRGERL